MYVQCNAHTICTYVGTYNVCMLFHPRMCKDEVEGYICLYILIHIQYM